MKPTKVFLCPGSSEYWAIRREAFALIALIQKNLSALDEDEEGPYWTALQLARSNDTVLEVLRAQGREALLTPALGPIPDLPEKPLDQLVADYFNWEPTDDPEVLLDRQCDEDSYRRHLEDMADYAPFIERIMTAEGIVRIVTESENDEETSSYRRETFLNGNLHDYEGKPAVIVRSHHRIPEEGYLDEDYEESYQHGVEMQRISHDDEVIANWSPGQRYAFGAADYDNQAA